MKKKQIVHPKLYLDIFKSDSEFILDYKSNVLNSKGERIIQKEMKQNISYKNKILFLVDKNKEQFNLLNKYLKIQKKVLEKHEKAGNYDSYLTLKCSMDVINDFKNDFEKWFKENNCYL